MVAGMPTNANLSFAGVVTVMVGIVVVVAVVVVLGLIVTLPFMNEACGSHTYSLSGESTPSIYLVKSTVIVFVHFEHSGVA